MAKKIILTNPSAAYTLSTSKKLSAKEMEQSKNYGQRNFFMESSTLPKDTVIAIGDKVDGYDSINDKNVTVYEIVEDVPGLAQKGQYIYAYWTKAYAEPEPPATGDFGPPHQWQLLVDALAVHTEEKPTSPKKGKLKKGKTYTLQQVFGAEPMYYCKDAKGFVAIADPKTNKFFWNLVTGDGKVIDVNKSKEKPSVTPTSKPSSSPAFGLAKPASNAPAVAQPVEATGGLSTSTILLIAGGVVLALLFLMPSGGGAGKRARA